jgi:hypothetical protein
MPGAFIVAARAVAIACATVSHLVRVVQVSPNLVTAPADLFDRSFSEVGILDDDGIRNFRQVLDHLVPDPAHSAVEQTPLSPAVNIGTVVNLVEAAIEAGDQQ